MPRLCAEELLTYLSPHYAEISSICADLRIDEARFAKLAADILQRFDIHFEHGRSKKLTRIVRVRERD